MLVYKNTANQTVYSRVVSLTGGSQNLVTGLSGAAENGLTSYISKDGGVFSGMSNPILEVGSGLYSLVLSQDDTNCNSAFVSMAVGNTGWFLFDPVYFQTTNVIQNAVKGATYDGYVTQEKVNEMLLSFMFGQVTVDDSSASLNVYSFKDATGNTSFTSFCSTSNGTRFVRGTTG